MDKKLLSKKQGNKFNKSNWRLVWGAISFLPVAFAGVLAIVGILESPAQAAPAVKPAITLESTKDNFNHNFNHNHSFKLAQVGISSPSNAPIPLDLRPRTHIPLPTDSRSRDDDYYSGYDYGYDHGYDHGYEDGYYQGKHRDYTHSSAMQSESFRASPSGRLRDRHRKDTVIIINPATSSTYESYGNYNYDNYERDNNQRGYIRIIRNQVSF